MALTKVLVTVKTYPTLSAKYEELVCTAGFLEDGSWIRIYPIPFRKKEFDEQFRKYDWIELDLDKNKKDFRPESYRPHSFESKIEIIGAASKEHNWEDRKKVVLRNVHTNITTLIAESRDRTKMTSLAVFKPSKILDFNVIQVSREWDKEKLKSLEAERAQFDLFKQPENPFQVVNKLPYKFVYKFLDCEGRESNLMIEDWEIGALFWRQLRKYEGNEAKAVDDVKKKYFTDFAKTKDLYFFFGTTQAHHLRSINPFIIIGTFHPKFETQLNLFN